jgi:hypothetical protein
VDGHPELLSVSVASESFVSVNRYDVNKPGRSAEFLGESYEKPFGPADLAESIRIFVPDHFAADKLGAVFTEPGERLVDVVHGEHHA